VYGNHDKRYDRRPPEGCISTDGVLSVYKGIRILGLGGCKSGNEVPCEFTEEKMVKRYQKCSKSIKKAGGIDILLTHAPARGMGDAETGHHQGFNIFLDIIEKYSPKYHFYGHVHKSYGVKTHDRSIGGTMLINACGYRIIEF
jgi:Icc-related predicted phosphoesterase